MKPPLLDDVQIQKALAKALVPRKYWDKSATLAKYGSVGLTLKEWVDAESFKDEAELGFCRFVVAKSPADMDVFYTLARAILLRGVSVMVISLPAFLHRMQDEDFREALEDVSVLFFAGFYDDGYDKAPMNDEQRYRVEWFLSNRIRNRKSIVFQASDAAPNCKWWSKYLLQLVATESVRVG